MRVSHGVGVSCREAVSTVTVTTSFQVERLSTPSLSTYAGCYECSSGAAVQRERRRSRMSELFSALNVALKAEDYQRALEVHARTHRAIRSCYLFCHDLASPLLCCLTVV